MKSIILLFFLSFTINLYAQDISYARKMVDTLASPYFWGRGYTKEGMQKAARFLSEEFKKLGLAPLNESSFFQDYDYPVNTFPGKMDVEINGQKLIAGKDFIVKPESRGGKFKGILSSTDSTHFCDQQGHVFFSLEKKLTWAPSQQVADYISIQVNKNQFKQIPLNYKLNIENKFVESYKALNVCGIVKGTLKPDSIILLTAHYDHLGGMGNKTYFPGANDNASGVALLLNLAKFYAAHPQPYSIAFICFSGEEAGLLGSKYFCEHPLIQLPNIRFLLNMDLVGTGDEGITVVNATELKKEFSYLTEINSSSGYLMKIKPRGKAANSDHYWFTQKKVPSFFIYTLGGIKAYHDIDDKAATLPLTSFENLFKLIRDFNEALMRKR